MLTPRQAYRIASQWGSYMHAGDPGACFCAFHLDDARPVSERHRKACLSWIKFSCLPATWDSVELNRAGVSGPRRPLTILTKDLRQLHQLRAFFLAAPLRSA